jgi:hypothetical protein
VLLRGSSTIHTSVITSLAESSQALFAAGGSQTIMAQYITRFVTLTPETVVCKHY